MGRYDDALTDLNRAIELDPDDGWLPYQLALVYLAQGRVDDFRRHIQRAIDLEQEDARSDPEDQRAALNIMVYLAALGSHAEARQQARAALMGKLGPGTIRDAIRDLREVQKATGHDVEDLIDLFQTRLLGDDEPGAPSAPRTHP